MTTLNLPELDSAKADAFANSLLDTVNKAGLALMLSIGHRTGLFDTLAELDPSTSPQVAEAANLDERYVREWLGAMVAGRVVEYDPVHKTYQLPGEHARFLTRASSPDNIAVTMQWVSVLGHVEDRIVERFKKGGGVAYECFHRFHEVMADESAQTVVAALDDHILPLVPGLVDKLTGGIDVLDVGCGAGRALCHLAQRFPRSRFTGYDLCDDTVAAANRWAKQRGLTNITFEQRDMTEVRGEPRFDLVTGFDVVHDQKDPAGVLKTIHRLLLPGGVFLMQDIRASSHPEKNIDHPVGTFLYTISCMSCMTVSLAQGGAGLGACWGEELALDMLRDAGFKTKMHRLDHDFINNYYINRKA